MTEKKPLDIKKIEQAQRHLELKISEEFIEENIAFVKSIADKLVKAGKCPPALDFEDLVSWGIEGLLKAKDAFNPDLKTKFQTYAYYRIQGEMKDKIRKEWNHRIPKEYQEHRKKMQKKLADLMENAIQDSTESPEKSLYDAVESASLAHLLNNELTHVATEKQGMKNPEEELIDDSQEEIWDEIQTLNDEEQKVVELFYVQGLKQFEIAEHLKYSKSKVCRIHTQLLEKLKKRFEKKDHYV